MPGRRSLKGALERAGIRVVVPGEDGTSYLNELIFGPLASGTKTDAIRRGVREIVGTMTSSTRLDAIIVGCTDLMDVLDTTVPLIDPIDCHVAHAVALARSKPNA